MGGRRPERVAEQIREEVSLIIAGEMNDPRVSFVTVTDASVSPDLRNCKVYVTVLGDEAQEREALTALNHAAVFIRRQLGAVMRIKHTPVLHFVLDETVRRAARIEELIDEEVAKAKAREREASAGEADASNDAG